MDKLTRYMVVAPDMATFSADGERIACWSLVYVLASDSEDAKWKARNSLDAGYVALVAFDESDLRGMIAEKRGITWEEHERIVAREMNPERKAYYWVCWYWGGAQTDMAMLKADNIDWKDKVLSYARRKTKELAQIHILTAARFDVRRIEKHWFHDVWEVRMKRASATLASQPRLANRQIHQILDGASISVERDEVIVDQQGTRIVCSFINSAGNEGVWT